MTEWITSVSDAVEVMRSPAIEKFFDEPSYRSHQFPFGLWFRGHSRIIDCLEPRVFRKHPPAPNSPEGTWDETNIFDHLKLRAPSHEITYRTAFDWLCFMQHYELPTRLLDWSESILAALYFAVKEDRYETGELVILNAKRLNGRSKIRPTISSRDDAHVLIRAEMATTRSLKRLKCKETVRQALEEDTQGKLRDRRGNPKRNWIECCRRPIAVFPRRLNERMVFQSSVFTVHGGKIYDECIHKQWRPDERMPKPISLDDVDREKPDDPILMRFHIPVQYKKRILDDLFRLGIHEAAFFPEVDRQASYLQRLWWYRMESASP